MRRNELDFGSQPVRNLYPNPGSETAGALLTLRTNLATNPSPSATAQQGWGTNGWGTGGVGTYDFINGAGRDGGYAGVQSWSTIATGGGASNFFGRTANNDIAVTAGNTYSFGIWMKTNQDTPNAAITVTFMDSGGLTVGSIVQGANTQATSGQWLNLIRENVVAPAGAVRVQMAGRITNLAGLANGLTLTVDDALVELGTQLNGPSFDGSTPAAGDYVYSWSGTANGSPALQKAYAVVSAVALNSNLIQSTDWSANGTKSLRVQPGQTATTDTAASLKGYTLKNGTYTLMATCRVKAAQTGSLDSNRARRIMLYYTGVGPSSSPAAPNAVGVYPLRVTFTVTDAAQYQDMRLYSGAAANGGDIWWDNIMLVEGDYQGDYINPSVTPLCRWDGTANASSSVGYPPQLIDIGGKPSLNLVGVNSGGVTIPVNAYDPRTIYLVYEDYGTTLNYPNYGAYGINGSNGITFQAGPAGNANLFPRLDFPGGSSNFGFTLAGGRSGIKRHVVALAFNNGLTSMTNCLDGGADTVVSGINPGSGWTDGRANPVSSHADGKGVAMLVYYAEHDRATRLAISRFLGNKHGANVA